ncbi:MAG TPA: hypothetical protein VLV85_02760 [Stellaceae bacterium]|nr:hypothetical protein [Stellaceae bacterium]
MSGKSGVLLIPLALGLLSVSASAQAPPDPSPPARQQAAAETLKERLSDKASDEQRVNNCKVPKDRRGPKPRPGCPQEEANRTKPPR